MTPDKESSEQMLVRVRELAKQCTVAPLDTAEIKEEETYECPICEGVGDIGGKQYINIGTTPTNVLLLNSGIGAGMAANGKLWESIPDMIRLINHLAAENAEYRVALEEGTRRLYCATKPTRGCIPDFGMTEKECDDLAVVFKEALASRGWRGEVKDNG